MESDKFEDETVEVMRCSLTAAPTKSMRWSVMSKKVTGVRNSRWKANTADLALLWILSMLCMFVGFQISWIFSRTCPL